MSPAADETTRGPGPAAAVAFDPDVTQVPPPDRDDRPGCVSAEAELVAAASDLVSGRRFRAWYQAADAPPRRGLIRRARAFPYVVEDVTAQRIAARLASWAAVVAWHDATVISPGWRVVDVSPIPLMDEAQASREPTHSDVKPAHAHARRRRRRR